MSGFLLLAGLFAVHVAAVLAGYLGPAARFSAGMLVLAANYPLRRLLFLDPALGGSGMAWYGLILLGDLTLGLLVAMSAVRPATGAGPWRPADVAVAALGLATLLLALLDARVPAMVRAAHWKEEYWPLAAYVLARLNGPGAAARPEALFGLAGLAVAVAVWQAARGPTGLDVAWIASGHSMLARDGAAAITGAHGLGNLEAGWIRPWGVFGNGSDLGVYLTAAGLLAVAGSLAAGRSLAGAVLRPLPLLCLAGIGLSAVRFTWAVAGLSGLLLAVLLARPGVPRALRALVLGGALAAGMAGFLAVAPLLGDSATLGGRLFVLGTWDDRVRTHAAVLARLEEAPAGWLTGEGFGAAGAAAAKFAPALREALPETHSRLADLLRDGGLGLLGLWLAPLLLAGLGGGDAAGRDPWRAAGLAFAWALTLVAAVLGGKSALLAGFGWAMLGLAVSRSKGR